MVQCKKHHLIQCFIRLPKSAMAALCPLDRGLQFGIAPNYAAQEMGSRQKKDVRINTAKWEFR